MTQNQLDRAVARATGETSATIRRRGFSEVPLRYVAVRERRVVVHKPVKLRIAS